MENQEHGPFYKILKGASAVFEKKFLYDVFKTFVGVFLAFWVAEWKNHKQSNFTERTALQEIRQELMLDIKDLQENLKGHQQGLAAASYFWNGLHGKPIGSDSLTREYNELLRSFLCIQHSAAYRRRMMPAGPTFQQPGPRGEATIFLPMATPKPCI